MFEKILQELKTKYANLGLSETILKAKAKQLAKAVEKEEDIENAVAGVEEDLAIFQSFADQNRTLAKKVADLEKEKGNQNPEPPKPENTAPAPTGEFAELFKALNDKIDKQNEMFAGLQAEKIAQTNVETMYSLVEQNGIPKSFLEGLPTIQTEFKSVEDIHTYVGKVKDSYDRQEQMINDLKISQSPKPLFGEAVKEGEVSADVQALIDSKKQS